MFGKEAITSRGTCKGGLVYPGFPLAKCLKQARSNQGFVHDKKPVELQ